MQLPNVREKFLFMSTPFSKFTFYIVGIGLLLPMNCVMAAMDFYKSIFP
jgi:hypothetical protein